VTAPAEPEVPSLGALIGNLGDGILRVFAAPRGLDVAVGDFVIHDPIDAPRIEPGDVVLAVGVPPEAREAQHLVAAAGAARAAAALFKGTIDTSGGLIDAANAADVALLGAVHDVGWARLHALLRTARSTGGHPLGALGAPVGDLFALANAVAAMAGGPATIEDPQSTVLAYSSGDDAIDEPRRDTILGRRVPDEWIARLTVDGIFRRLWSSDDVVHIDYPDIPGLRPRIAIAVRAGTEILGSIWVHEAAKPLGPDAEVALRQAARIAALHLIRHHAGEDLERQRRAEVLRAALEGRLPPNLLPDFLELGRDRVTVLAFEVLGAEGAERLLQMERAVNLIALYGEAYRRATACVAIGRVIYVLVPTADGTAVSDLVKLATDIVERTESSLRVHVRGAVGTTVNSLHQLPDSRSAADAVLRALVFREDERSVAHVDDVRAHIVLLELRGQSDALVEGKVRRMVEHDADHDTAYAESLKAYLDFFGDVPRAATSVNVHANTLRYRLRRAAELFEIDLDDPVERLVAHLQLYLME
jgi:hypothetical protein